MNNFEEQYTAWLDGTMNEAEQREFEAGLPDLAAARADRDGWRNLGALMRESLAPEPMPHAEFLNAQVLAGIRRDEPPRTRAGGWISIGRLAWSGAFLLAVAGVLSFFTLSSLERRPTNEQFISQVVKARAAAQSPNAYSFAAPGGKGAVLWVDDAGYIPAEERIK